MSIKSGLNTE